MAFKALSIEEFKSVERDIAEGRLTANGVPVIRFRPGVKLPSYKFNVSRRGYEAGEYSPRKGDEMRGPFRLPSAAFTRDGLRAKIWDKHDVFVWVNIADIEIDYQVG